MNRIEARQHYLEALAHAADALALQARHCRDDLAASVIDDGLIQQPPGSNSRMLLLHDIVTMIEPAARLAEVM